MKMQVLECIGDLNLPRYYLCIVPEPSRGSNHFDIKSLIDESLGEPPGAYRGLECTNREHTQILSKRRVKRRPKPLKFQILKMIGSGPNQLSISARFFLVWGADRFSHVLELGVESFSQPPSWILPHLQKKPCLCCGIATGLQFRRNSLSGLLCPVRTVRGQKTFQLLLSQFPGTHRFQDIKQFASSNLKAPSIGTRDLLKRSRKRIRDGSGNSTVERGREPQEDAR